MSARRSCCVTSRNSNASSNELEKKLEERTAKPRYDGPIVRGRGPATKQTPLRALSEKEAQPANDHAQTVAAAASAATNQPANGQAGSDSGQPPALTAPEDMDALRDLMVIRDQAVTVKKGGLDVGAQFRYVRASGFLQFSRAVIGALTARYGLFEGVEVSANLPGFHAYRSTQTLPGTFLKNEEWALGDFSAQVTGTLVKETLNWPAVFGYATVSFPTGPLPYTRIAGQIFANPIDPFYFFQTLGHFAGTVGMTMVKTYEPIALFAGLNYTYVLPREVTGSKFDRGDQLGYSLGMGLAVSERTTLGAMVQGVIQSEMKVDGTKAAGTNAESVVLVLSLSQRFAPGFYFEPSVSIGMTSDVPSAAIGLNVRKTLW